MIAIRPAEPTDKQAILDLVRSAFATRGHDGEEEVAIVRKTWEMQAAPAELDLVAVDADRVVGHALGARGRLAGREAIGLAPLAVAPDRQRQGVGTALVNELVARAEAQHWPLVVLLGSPRYYGRLGFEPAARFGITYAGTPSGHPEAFQVRRLAAYDSSWRGEFRYCWEL